MKPGARASGAFAGSAARVDAIAGARFDYPGFFAPGAGAVSRALGIGFGFVAGAFFVPANSADRDGVGRRQPFHPGLALAPRRFRFSARFTAAGAFSCNSHFRSVF